MKRLLCTLMLLILLPVCVHAQGELPSEAQDILDQPGITAEDFQSFSFSDLISPIVQAAKEQIQSPVRLFVTILGGTLLGSAVIAFLPGDETIETICILGIFAASLSPVLDLVSRISNQIADWQTYLISFVPVFSGAMMTCGQVTQAAVYSGMFLTMATFVSQIIQTIALSVVQVLVALYTAGGVCTVQGLSDGCALLNKTVKWILSVLSILFTTVLGLQSVLAQNTDNLAMKTGRFVVSSSIPIVGSVASEAMGSVLSGLKILKGSLGFAAIAVLSISFFPILLQSMGFYIAYNLGGATAKSFGLPRAAKILEGLGQCVALCIAFLVFFFLLVVISTALMIVMGGG